MSSTQINAHLIMECRSLPNVSEQLRMFYRQKKKKKRVGEVFPNFRLELNTLGILSDPTDENRKD
jgi:hypothetical protein